MLLPYHLLPLSISSEFAGGIVLHGNNCRVSVNILRMFINTLASRGALLVTPLLFAALRAEHCCTPVAPLRGVPGSVVSTVLYIVRYRTVPVPYSTTVRYFGSRNPFLTVATVQYGTVPGTVPCLTPQGFAAPCLGRKKTTIHNRSRRPDDARMLWGYRTYE